MSNKCDSCAHYEYDEEYECYVCEMNLDEDEWYRQTKKQLKLVSLYTIVLRENQSLTLLMLLEELST